MGAFLLKWTVWIALGAIALGAVGGYALDPGSTFARRLAGGAGAVTIVGAVIAIAIFAWSRWISAENALQLGALGRKMGSIEDKLLTPALLEGDDGPRAEDVERPPVEE